MHEAASIGQSNDCFASKIGRESSSLERSLANEEGAEDEDDTSTPSLDNHVHDKGAAAATILEENEVTEIYIIIII